MTSLYHQLYKTGLLTDYKVEIVSPSARATFLLHRNLLAVSGQYFYSLFQSVRKSPIDTNDTFNQSVFQMDEKDIDAFDNVVIPYIYLQDDLAITNENCLSVISMADYFQMKNLLVYVKDHFLSSENIIDIIEAYMSVAGEQTFLDLLIEKARELLDQILPKDIVHLSNFSILSKILNENDHTELICSWIRSHREQATIENNFKLLTKNITYKLDNVLLLYAIAAQIKYTPVMNKCMELISDNWYTLTKDTDLAYNTIDTLVVLLSQSLIMEGEERISEAICTFLDNVVPEIQDEQQLVHVWSSVRVMQLTKEGWLKYVNRNDIPQSLLRESARKRAQLAVSKNPQSLITPVQYYHILDIKYHEDQTGLLFWLGCNKGKELSYTNPCATGLVTIKSANAQYVGEPQDLLSHDNIHSKIVLDHTGTITLDLGTVRITPTYYTINAAGNITDKHWMLKGSNDGEHYDTISVHKNEGKKRSDFGAFECYNGSRLYSILQIQMVGQSTESLELYRCEFYGRIIYPK
jgi:hypothetical protein